MMDAGFVLDRRVVESLRKGGSSIDFGSWRCIAAVMIGTIR